MLPAVTTVAARTTVAASLMCAALPGLVAGDASRRGLWVHSVFRSVINLASGDGRLIAIADRSVGGLPHGILVQGIADFRALGIVRGTVASMSVDSVVVGVALRVELGAAEPWSGRLSRLDGRAWRERSAHVHAIADTRSVRPGLDQMPAARSTLEALGAALSDGDHPRALAAADRLVGLGPGLTPSGDDALLGVEAALHVVGHARSGSLVGSLADLDRRTTTVSAAMLRHAARGEAAERIHRLLAVLLAPSTAGLADTLDDAVAWGATSGADTLAGVLVALDAVTPADDRRRAA